MIERAKSTKPSSRGGGRYKYYYTGATGNSNFRNYFLQGTNVNIKITISLKDDYYGDKNLFTN